jgi:hypothetical protein
MRTDLFARWFARVVPGLALAACFTPLESLPAQTNPADASAQKIEDKRAATATFLERSRSDAERLAAVKSLGYPDAKTFAALLAIGSDRTESDAIRWEALRKHRFDDKYIELVLKIITDPDDGSEELDSNLVEDMNRRITFTLPAELKQEIMAAWKKLLDDPREKVRVSAYRVLVYNHDPVAVNRLSESLRKEADVPIPLHEAIELLDVDGAINHIGALRPYLNHDDPRAQGWAARALTVDPQSRPKIVELANNLRTPKEVRLHALRGLAREDENFASYAIALVENAEEDGDVRYAAMHDFAGRMNYGKVEAADQVRFAQAVEKLAGESALKMTNEQEKIRKAARELHGYLKEVFPEVRKHYEKK